MKKLLTFATLLLLCSSAQAVPNFLTHQGEISENSGPVTGSASVVFKLYADAEGGSALWTQTIDVTFDNGFYSVVLGSDSSPMDTDLFDGSDLYLGITFEDNGEFTPRNRVTSVPYAIRAGSVTGEVNAVDGLTVDGAEVIDSDGVFHGNGLHINGEEIVDSTGNLNVNGNISGDTLTLPQGLLEDLPSASEDNQGQVYFATDTGTIYYSDGNQWTEVGSGIGDALYAPSIVSLSPNQIEPGTSVDITLTGEHFEDGCTVQFGTTSSENVVFNSANEVIASSPELESGDYTIHVNNPVGLNGYLVDGLSVDATPEWVTEEGSLGHALDSATGDHFTIEVSDAEGQEITFELTAGSLPTGYSLDTETGIISGSTDEVSEDTEYNFTITATDTAATPHVIERAFSLTVIHQRPVELEIWSGYCNTTSSAGGWNNYCTNVTEFNTIQGDKITINNNGTFTINTAGFYRFNFFAISHGASWAYVQFLVNGNSKYYGHEYGEGNNWTDSFVDQTWQFNAGDTLYIRVHNPGTHAYHSGNANGAHSRLQLQYMGPLTDGEEPAHKIWSGYCSSHGTAGGWNTYCTNATDFNTIGSKLSINNNGTFTVNEAGYYRINQWAISHGNNNAHIRLIVNGTVRYYSHENGPNTWTDNFLDQTWKFNAGDTFYISIHNPGSYAFHQGSAVGNHSRLQVNWVGPLVQETEGVPIMWSGYCSNNGTASGYNKYCANNTEWDNLDGMLSIATDGTITVNQAGYYRINSAVISNGTGYASAILRVNSGYVYHGHEYVYGNTWSDNFIDQIWHFDSGDTVYVDYNNPGSYAYHPSNSGGTYGRLQLHFMGYSN